MLRLFKRQDINDELWNQTIYQSCNGVIYALTHFLDQTIHKWEAIIDFNENDSNPYKIIMPLIIGKKYGLRYMAHEPFLTELGIFSKQVLVQQKVAEIIKAARNLTVKINNYPFENSLSQLVSASLDGIYLKEAQLNQLSLNISYKQLLKGYNRNRSRILKRAGDLPLIVAETNDIETHVRLFKAFIYPKIKGMQSHQLDQLKKIYYAMASHGLAKIYDVRYENITLSSGIFLFFNKVITYYTCTNSDLGKKYNSPSILLDFIIKKYSSSPLILEAYSGSHSGVDYFYRSFNFSKKNLFIWNNQKIKISKTALSILNPIKN